MVYYFLIRQIALSPDLGITSGIPVSGLVTLLDPFPALTPTPGSPSARRDGRAESAQDFAVRFMSCLFIVSCFILFLIFLVVFRIFEEWVEFKCVFCIYISVSCSDAYVVVMV